MGQKLSQCREELSTCVCGIGDLEKQVHWSPKLLIMQPFGSKCEKNNCTTHSGKCRELVKAKLMHRGFCTSETRILGRILGNEFWTPEFWTRILGSNFFILVFPAKEAPRKIHPQEIRLPKFTFQNSTQKSCQKTHIAPLQGRLADELVLYA